ncbi:MAG: acyltransferase family protein [Thermodesulforhabdaceae bacterium]
MVEEIHTDRAREMTSIMRPIESRNLSWDPRLAHVRCIAALLVFVFHVFHVFFGHWQPQPGFSGIGFIVEGYTGVSLFFVLSGYLFMSIAIRSKGRIDYVKFIRNRFLRVFPLFLFVFFVSISMHRDQFQPQDILYLFFSNIGKPPTSNYFITGAAWTISVEFTFYLIFPFIARFTLEQGARYLIKFILLVLIFRTAAYFVIERSTHMIYSTLLGRTDQFLIGMLAAYLVQHGRAGEYIRKEWSGNNSFARSGNSYVGCN